MKVTSHLEKWASGVLGAVCLLLLVNLVLQFGGARAGASRPTMPAVQPGGPGRLQTVHSGGVDELARYDPVVRLDQLKQYQERPLPKMSRDPFEFVQTRLAPHPVETVTPPPAEPTGPPPVPLVGVGYAEKAGGVREAYVSDGEEIYVVQEGQTFAKNYKVLKITSAMVEIEDETFHRTVQLPFPQ